MEIVKLSNDFTVSIHIISFLPQYDMIFNIHCSQTLTAIFIISDHNNSQFLFLSYICLQYFSPICYAKQYISRIVFKQPAVPTTLPAVIPEPLLILKWFPESFLFCKALWPTPLLFSFLQFQFLYSR